MWIAGRHLESEKIVDGAVYINWRYDLRIDGLIGMWIGGGCVVVSGVGGVGDDGSDGGNCAIDGAYVMV